MAHTPHNSRRNNDGSNEKQVLPPIDLVNVESTLFNQQADECAKCIADNGESRHNKSTQLRRFYDEIVLWHEKVSFDDSKFEEYLPFIQMIVAKAAYAKGRDLIDKSFFNFLKNLIEQVNSLQTFNTLKTFMEAFMGFYKMYKSK